MRIVAATETVLAICSTLNFKENHYEKHYYKNLNLFSVGNV